MKILTSREYAGEKEAFVPLIGFKVVSVENGSAKGNITGLLRVDWNM